MIEKTKSDVLQDDLHAASFFSLTLWVFYLYCFFSLGISLFQATTEVV